MELEQTDSKVYYRLYLFYRWSTNRYNFFKPVTKPQGAPEAWLQVKL